MKRILFPTDFSVLLEDAFLFALRLAKLNKAEVILLHTYELPILDGQFIAINTNQLYDSIDLMELDHFKENVSKLRGLAQENNLDEVILQHKLALGDLNYNINKTITEEKIDFLVMETSGGDNWFSKILGTNADSVLSTVEIPSFIIPQGYQKDTIETIGFTTRFRDKDKIALKQTLELAKRLQCKVKCLYVNTTDSKNNDVKLMEWKSEFQNEPVSFYEESNDDVFEAVDFFIFHQEIDILAMVTYKIDFFTDLFRKSFTKKVTHRSAIPVLVLH